MQITKENKICIAPFFPAALLELRNPIRRGVHFQIQYGAARVRAYGGVYLHGIINTMGPGLPPVIQKIKNLATDNVWARDVSSLGRGSICQRRKRTTGRGQNCFNSCLQGYVRPSPDMQFSITRRDYRGLNPRKACASSLYIGCFDVNLLKR